MFNSEPRTHQQVMFRHFWMVGADRDLHPCRPQNSRARGTRVRQFGLRACANQRPDNYRGLFEANRVLPQDMKDCLAHACQIEESPLGREVLGDIVRNYEPPWAQR